MESLRRAASWNRRRSQKGTVKVERKRTRSSSVDKLHLEPPQIPIILSKYNLLVTIYLPPTDLREGNVFKRVCPPVNEFVHRGPVQRGAILRM